MPDRHAAAIEHVTQKGKRLFAELTGDLAKLAVEEERVRAAARTLDKHHDKSLRVARAGIRSVRGSALESAYLDTVRARGLARTLTTPSEDDDA